MVEDVKVKVSVDMGKGDDSLEGLVKQLNAVDVAVNTVNASLGKSTSVFGRYQASVKETTRILGKLIGAQKRVANSSIGATSNISAIKRAEEQIVAMKQKSAQDIIGLVNKTKSAEAAAAREIARIKNQMNNLVLAEIKREEKELATAKNQMNSLVLAQIKQESVAAIALKKTQYKTMLSNLDVYVKARNSKLKAAAKEAERVRTLPQDSHVASYKTALKASKEQNNLLRTRSSWLDKIANIHKTILGHIFGVVAGYRLVNSAINLMLRGLKSVPDALIDLQTTQSVFAATLGSEAEGVSVMKALREEADRTGISITVLRENFRNLNASMGIAGETIETTWSVFTNMNTAITALHLSGEKAIGIFEAIQQTFNKGKIQSEELTKQLGNRLPGAFAAFAKATKRTTAELASDMKKGLVEAHIELEKFARFYGDTFLVSMSIASEGLQANLGRLSTSFTLLAEAVGYELEESMLTTVKLLTKLTDAVTVLVKEAHALEVVLGALAGGALGAVIATIAGAIGALSTSFVGLKSGISKIKDLKSAFKGLLALVVGLKNPWLVAIGAITLGTVAFFNAQKSEIEEAEELLAKYASKAENAAKKVNNAAKGIAFTIQNDPKLSEIDSSLSRLEARLAGFKEEAKVAATSSGPFGVLGDRKDGKGADRAKEIKQIKTNILALNKEKESTIKKLGGEASDSRAKAKQTELDRLAGLEVTAIEDLQSTRVSGTRKSIAMVNALYDNNRLSVRVYYDNLNALQQEAFEERINQIKSQLREQSRLIAEAPEGAKQQLQAKQQRLGTKLFNMEQDQASKQVKTKGEAVTAQRKFNDSLLQTSQNYYTLIGDAEKAAEAQNKLLDFRVIKLKTEAFDGTDKGLAAEAIAQIEYTIANTKAQAKLTNSIRDTTIAEEVLNNSVVRIDARRAASTQTELKSMLQRAAASQEYIDLQKEIIAQAEAEYNPIADQNGDIRRSIDEMTASLYAFQQTSNEVVVFARTTLNDALSSSFKDFITGAKSAGEAMKGFTLTVLDSIAQIAANQLANQLIGGLFDVIGLGTSGLSTSTKGLGTSATTQISGSANLAKVDILSLLEPKPFAKGGIPDIGSSPATFAMGSLREGGTPEAIMPLQRDSKGNLGVSASGAGGSGVVIGSINVSVVEKADSSTQEQAAAISKAVGDQLKALVQQGIASASRPGNQLNPTQIVGVF